MEYAAKLPIVPKPTPAVVRHKGNPAEIAIANASLGDFQAEAVGKALKHST